jgi:hypothetical protein
VLVVDHNYSKDKISQKYSTDVEKSMGLDVGKIIYVLG